MPGKVKTRDRILNAALALFNEEGEAQISTVDIAGVLDISPGNLYYHFRGKEAIIEALFDNFEEEIRLVLSAPIKRALSLEDNWIFVYIVFEEINDFRFFYYGLSSILERCPELRPRMMRLLKLKQETVKAVLTTLEREKFLAFEKGELSALSARLAAHLTFWLQYQDLASASRDSRDIINSGVYTTMMQVAPYLRENRKEYLELLSEFFSAKNG